MVLATAYTATAIVGFALIFNGFARLDAIYAAEDRDHQERFASIRGLH